MKGLPLMKKALGFMRGMGVKATLRKVGQRIRTDKMLAKVRMKPYTEADIAAQRGKKLPGAGKICVMADVRGAGDTIALIDSLLAQTYDNWTLCLIGCGSLPPQKDARIIASDVPSADADYVALLAPGCTLHPCALYEAMREMTQNGADLVYTDETDADAGPLYKPDYAPDTLRSMNYIGGFMAMRAQLLESAGGMGGGAYDLTLRLTEQAKTIAHVQRALCTRTIPLPCDAQADMRAIGAHLERCGLAGAVECGSVPGVYRTRYAIEKPGLVSILIPNKDHTDDLLRCIDSLREKTTYPDWEIIIIENNSTEKQTFACYEELKKDKRIRVVVWKDIFNYAAINNFGETYARGEYLLLLNNDMEIIAPDWIEQMLMFAQRQDVGAVGAMLYFPDDTVQHGGVIVGIGGVADHAHKEFARGDSGYMNRLAAVQNLSAVTAACLMMRRSVYREIGGFDAAFQVAFNDVDLCMRIREVGYLIVWTPYAELYHCESKSRGLDETPEKYFRYAGEVERFQRRWMHRLVNGDPYYNRNLTQERTDFGV